MSFKGPSQILNTKLHFWFDWLSFWRQGDKNFSFFRMRFNIFSSLKIHLLMSPIKELLHLIPFFLIHLLSAKTIYLPLKESLKIWALKLLFQWKTLTPISRILTLKLKMFLTVLSTFQTTLKHRMTLIKDLLIKVIWQIKQIVKIH
jgi:hypothetical protein